MQTIPEEDLDAMYDDDDNLDDMYDDDDDAADDADASAAASSAAAASPPVTMSDDRKFRGEVGYKLVSRMSHFEYLQALATFSYPIANRCLFCELNSDRVLQLWAHSCIARRCEQKKPKPVSTSCAVCSSLHLGLFISVCC